MVCLFQEDKRNDHALIFFSISIVTLLSRKFSIRYYPRKRLEKIFLLKSVTKSTTFWRVLRLSIENLNGKEGENLTAYKKDEIASWYDQHSKSVLSFILLIVKDYQQAEDLTHDTFIKAYLYYDSFKSYSSEKTWLFSIAHNLTVDFLRKRKPALILKEMFHLQKDSVPLPEEIVRIKEESYELYKALGELKDTYRKVIILRKIKGFSIEDTAMILSWSESKVKSTLFRALPALKKQLLKEGYSSEEAIQRY